MIRTVLHLARRALAMTMLLGVWFTKWGAWLVTLATAGYVLHHLIGGPAVSRASELWYAAVFFPAALALLGVSHWLLVNSVGGTSHAREALLAWTKNGWPLWWHSAACSLMLAALAWSGRAAGRWAPWVDAIATSVSSVLMLALILRKGESEAVFTSDSPMASAGVTSTAPLDADYPAPVSAQQPRRRLADIHGMVEAKARLLAAAQEVLGRRHPGEPPRNGILMHGTPGNGKTIFAEAVAGELGVPLVSLTYGDVASKWVGDTPRLLKAAFAYARSKAPCVLFIDEVDSLLRSREAAGSHAEDLKATNTLLTEIVGVRRDAVLLIAATNFLDRLDTAAIRDGRFDYKIEIPAPDLEARVGLLTESARKFAHGRPVDTAGLHSIAARWQGFSASRLIAIGRELGASNQPAGEVIGVDAWSRALRSVQGQRSSRLLSKSLRDLVLEPSTRESLSLLAARMRDVHQLHERGGTLPRGVLFHGPAGTGKTAAAQALATESGWCFIDVAGPELLHDTDLLRRLMADAADLRPAVVFIDEADDVLRDRAMHHRPDIVNSLLAMMDGAGEVTPDVLVLAATNHPEDVDPALWRAGRFSEKVRFTLPGHAERCALIEGWLGSRPARLESRLASEVISARLDGLSAADIHGVLQYALNRAIGRTPLARVGDSTPLTLEDLRAGMEVIAGDRQDVHSRQLRL